MLYLAAALLCIGFIEGYSRFRLHFHFEEIAGSSKRALLTLSSKTEDDETKERIARQTSLLILKQTFLFVGKLLLLLSLLSAAVYGLLLLAGIPQAEFLALMSSGPALCGMIVFSLLYLAVRNLTVRNVAR